MHSSRSPKTWTVSRTTLAAIGALSPPLPLPLPLLLSRLLLLVEVDVLKRMKAQKPSRRLGGLCLEQPRPLLGRRLLMRLEWVEWINWGVDWLGSLAHSSRRLRSKAQLAAAAAAGGEERVSVQWASSEQRARVLATRGELKKEVLLELASCVRVNRCWIGRPRSDSSESAVGRLIQPPAEIDFAQIGLD